MKAIDIGSGSNPERWLLGADTCELNSDDSEGKVTFTQLASTKTPLPVEDATYDLIWCSYSWRSINQSDHLSVAKELSRIAKDGATLILRDYCVDIDQETGEEIEIPSKTWLRIIKALFADWKTEDTCPFIASYTDATVGVVFLKRCKRKE